MMHAKTIGATVVICAAAAQVLSAEPVPLGHRDFYPSPERPIGWRGDGHASFPGATPITKWQEGIRKKIGWKKYAWANRERKGIVWKKKLRCFSNAQPIVIGDRVITTSEPSSLVCLDVNTGETLWIRENIPFDVMGMSEEKSDALQTYLEQLYCTIATFRPLVGNYTRLASKNYPRVVARNRARWLKHARWQDDVFRAMNRGPHAARVQEALDLTMDAIAAFHALTPGDDPSELNSVMVKPAGKAAVWIQPEFGFYPASHWDGYTGWTFPTPITDGEFIYANIGQGQVVCYDITGKRIWWRHFKRTSGKRVGTPGCNMAVEYCASPLLIGDVLIAQVTARPEKCDGLYGLNKKTGEVIWSTDKVGHTVKSHCRLSLPLPGGGTLDAVACPDGKVLRVRDGKIIGALGADSGHGPTGSGSSDITEGHRWYWMGNGKVVGFELTAASEDKVTAKQLWEVPCRQMSHTSVLHAGHLHRFGEGGPIINVKDGSHVMCAKKYKDGVFTMRMHYPSPIVAGKYLMSFEMAGRRGKPFLVNSQVLEMVSPNHPKMVAEENMLDGDPIPNMPRLETHIPGYKPGDLYSQCGGTPTQFGYSSLFAHANRVFLRSVSHLYCLGDPKVPYDWNPSSRPKRITGKLEAAARELAERDPVDALSSKYAWDREQGRKAIVALAPGKQKATLDRVAKLTSGEGWRTLREAARTLGEIGPAAAPVLPALQESLEKWLAAGKLNRAAEILSAIQKIEPKAPTAALPHVAKSLGGGNVGVQRVACRLAEQIGADADQVTPGLLKALSSADAGVAMDAAYALQRVGLTDGKVVPALAEAIKRKEKWVVVPSLEALKLRAKKAGAAAVPIGQCLKRKDLRTQLAAMEALAAMGSAAKPAIPALRGALHHTDSRIVCSAADLLFKLDAASEKKVAMAMAKNLASAKDELVQSNIRAFGVVGPKIKGKVVMMDVVDAMVKVLEKRSPKLKRETAMALAEFGTKAKAATQALREAAMGKDCKEEAKAALAKVAPGMDLKKIEPETDDDLGLDQSGPGPQPNRSPARSKVQVASEGKVFSRSQ